MGQFLSSVDIRILRFLEGLLECLYLLMRKLGATATLFAGNEEIILQTAVGVTWGKCAQSFEFYI